MKSNNILKTSALVAMLTLAPSLAEAKDNRDRIHHVIKDSDGNWKQVPTDEANGTSTRRPKGTHIYRAVRDSNGNWQKVPNDEANDISEKNEITPDSHEARALFAVLEARFSKRSPFRHAGVKFADVKKSLEARPDLLYSLKYMEKSGGAPDVVYVDGNFFVFADVSETSPEGRRDLSFNEAKAMCNKMGLIMMHKEAYIELQKRGNLDVETWIWILKNTEPTFQMSDAEDEDADGMLIRLHKGRDITHRTFWHMEVIESHTVFHDPRGSFRSILNVPKL